MRLMWLLLVLASAAPLQRAAAGETLVWPLHSGSTQALQTALIAFTQEQLQSMGLSIDSRRARMSFSAPLPETGMAEIRPAWSGDAPLPALPLTFVLKLRDAQANKPSARPILITLAAPLLREVLVASRRLRKGSIVSCADLDMQRREVRTPPALALALPCHLAVETVAMRDLAANDVVGLRDVGSAPEVTAGAPVSVSVASRGIVVATTAVALADARVGDQIDVRLQHPARVLRTRVIGPAAVQLVDVPQ